MNQSLVITKQLKTIIPLFEQFNIGEDFPITQPFSKEVIDHVSDINKINFENLLEKDLIDIISTYSYLGLNSKEPIDELVWRDGSKTKSELFIINYDRKSNYKNTGVINKNLSYILKNELKIHCNDNVSFLTSVQMNRQVLDEYFVPFNNIAYDILVSKNSRLMKWYIDTKDTKIDTNRLLCIAINGKDLKMIDILLATLKDENNIIQFSNENEGRIYLVELLCKFRENNFILNESIVQMKIR